MAPPMDAPTTCTVSNPASSSTAIASSAIWSSEYAPCGLSLRPEAAVVERDGVDRPGQPQPLEVPAMLVGAEALDEQHGRAASAARHAVVDASPVVSRRVHVTSASAHSRQWEPIERRAGLRSTELVEQALDAFFDGVGELELDERAAAPPAGTGDSTDLGGLPG